MKRNISLLWLLLVSLSGFAQPLGNINIDACVKNSEAAISFKDNISEIVKITQEQFLILANDTSAELNKTIQTSFKSYKKNLENIENNIYPQNLSAQNLSVQVLKYSDSYGLKDSDATFSLEILTCLVLIPSCDYIHKGEIIANLCFKTEIERYTITNQVDKTVREEIRPLAVKHINL